jgi:hypothetical protein
MAEFVEVEEHYPVPSHLRTQQSIGPFPARFILPMSYGGVFIGIPVGISVYQATDGMLLPSILAGMLPAALLSPVAAWWLDPPFEHGFLKAAAFVKRAYVRPQLAPLGKPVAVYRMPTLNLETADTGMRRQARAQWGSILNGLGHPIKILVRARPITTLPVVEDLQRDPRPAAQHLGRWLETELAQAGLIERERFLVIPADNEAELQFRAEAIENVLRQARLQAERIEPGHLPLLRTMTWDPKATEPRDEPEVMEEGTTELVADGWWTRAYALGQFPSTILTNWASPMLAGDEAVDVAIDVVPQDAGDIKTWVLQPKINALSTSSLTRKRLIALEQLTTLYDAIERRHVAPFEVAVTVIVRGNSRQDVRDRAKKTERRVRNLGGKLHLLRWEQAAGLRQMDPTVSTPLGRRTHLIETGTLARTYPWSDAYLQLDGGVPWGEAGNRVCLFTPYCKGNKGPHMCWYGATNAGKGTGAHMLWSRLHLIQGMRIFGIDQDEQHEHCGRFLEYLGGRKLTPRDVQDTKDIVLHRDDGVVILDLSDHDEDLAGAIFAAWVEVVKRHMLAHPGRSIVFVDEATRIIENAAAEKALRHIFERSRHWGQSSHAMTQRPSTWFDTRVGRAVQGNSDQWWCGGQMPRELNEVAEGLELTAEEKQAVRKAGLGQGLLVSGQRRVMLNLFDKLSCEEYDAFHSDPVLEELTEPLPIPLRRALV